MICRQERGSFLRELNSVRNFLFNTPTVPHLELHLLHGRNDPDQDMHDTGFVGPVLRGFACAHHAYTSFLTLDPKIGPMGTVLVPYGDMLQLVMLESDAVLLGFDEDKGEATTLHGTSVRVMYFGDWEYRLGGVNGT